MFKQVRTLMSVFTFTHLPPALTFYLHLLKPNFLPSLSWFLSRSENVQILLVEVLGRLFLFHVCKAQICTAVRAPVCSVIPGSQAKITISSSKWWSAAFALQTLFNVQLCVGELWL